MSAPSTVEADVPPLLSSKQVAEIAENAGIDGKRGSGGQPLDWQIACGNCGNSLQILCIPLSRAILCHEESNLYRAIGLSVIGVLTGCSNEVWVKAGMTQAEYQKDSYECGQSAGMNTGSYGSSLDAAQQAKSAKSRCMIARGYTLQKADSVDPALKLVNCKFKEVDQVQRLSAQSCTNSGGTVVDDAD